jgi:putative DNA primase/helicase
MLDNTVFSSSMPNGQDYSANSGVASNSGDINSEIKRQYREYHIDSFGDLPDEEFGGETYDDGSRIQGGVPRSAHDRNDDKGGPVHCDTPLRRYRMERTGLFYFPEAKKHAERVDEEVRPIWLSPQFEVIARTQDPDGNWGKLLRWNDHNGAEIKWVMPARLLGGHRDELWQALYERGLEISSATGARNLLLAYLTHANPKGRANVVSRTGWYTDHGVTAFVLPDVVYGERRGSEIIYTGNVASSPYRVKGSLEEWRDRVGRPCIGNSRLAFAVSIAFAPPLLHIVGEESGGFHYKGDSRAGKTTAERLSGSVWGGGDGVNGYVKSYRTTSNGLEGVCEEHCDALLCLDEMGQVDAREAGEIVYMIANQGGKQRASRDGSARRAKQWRIMFLSTGEISLADKMTEIGRKPRAGQEVRLVDIPADAGAGYGIFENLHGVKSAGEFADQLKRATLECYGTPIRAYLDFVANSFAGNPTDTTAVFRELRDDFIARNLPDGASGQVRSVCGRFGLVAAGGELATGLGLTGWPKDEATRTAVTCFNAWLEQRGTVGDHDLEAGIRQVISYIEQYGGSRFEEILSDDESTVFNRVGFRRYDSFSKKWEYFVLPEQWKNELAKGYNAAALAKEMVKREMIIPQGGKTSAAVRLGRHGNMRVYRLAPGIISGDVADAKQADDASSRQSWIDRMMGDPC